MVYKTRVCVSLSLANSVTSVAVQCVTVNAEGVWSATFVHDGSYTEYRIAVSARDAAGNLAFREVPSFFVGEVVQPGPEEQPIGRPEDEDDSENESPVSDTIIPELPYTPAITSQHDLVMPEDSDRVGAISGGDGGADNTNQTEQDLSDDVTTENEASQGLAWYWWLLIAGGAGTVGWFILGRSARER